MDSQIATEIAAFAEKVKTRIAAHGLRVVSVETQKPTMQCFGVTGGTAKTRTIRTLVEVARGEEVLGLVSFDHSETWFDITSTAVRGAYKGPRHTKGIGRFGYSERKLMDALGVKPS